MRRDDERTFVLYSITSNPITKSETEPLGRAFTKSQLLDELCETFGIAYKGTVMYTTITNKENTAQAIIQLATACVAFVHTVTRHPS